MIAAIYARKSTEQTGMADEEKSVTRQVEHARAYAERKGWAVAEEHVYVDDGISGAEFGAKRPGLARLLNALRPRAPFAVLVMSEESRLGREMAETLYILKQLVTAGVRVFSYLEDRERTLDSPTDKFLLAAAGYADEVERDKARQRTYDAMARKARAGHVTGGVVFGYENREVLADVPGADGRRRRLHVERVIKPEEAAVVREIFELAAAGKGVRRIAQDLNARGVAAPLPRLAGRSRSWAPSSVRMILVRPLYRGEIVWNQAKKRTAWGTKKPTRRDPAEWIRVRKPELRIVPDALWQRAQERLATSRAAYLRDTSGHLWGRPANGIESKYLLTGMAACGCCGGSLIVRSRVSGKHRAFAYTCSYHHLRGQTVCANALVLPMEPTNQEILTHLQQEVLIPEAVELTIRKTLERVRPSGDAVDAQRAALTAELARLEDELGRLTAAIAAGGTLASLVAALQARERRRGELQLELVQLEGGAALWQTDLARVRREIRSRLTEWQTFLGRNVLQARQVLRRFLEGRVVYTPQREADGTYTFAGTVNLWSLVSGVLRSKAVVSPTGFEPVFPD